MGDPHAAGEALIWPSVIFKPVLNFYFQQIAAKSYPDNNSLKLIFYENY